MFTRRTLIKTLAAALAGRALMPSAAWPAQARPDHAPLLIDGLCIPFPLAQTTALKPDLAAQVRASGLTAVNMTTPYPGDEYEETYKKINKLKSVIKLNSNIFHLVRSDADLALCQATGRLGIIVGFQSTEMFDSGLERIEPLHQAGLRIAQMSYNGPGLLGHGCLSGSGAGLTAVGREAIERFNAAGVLIDLSHANKRTTAESIRCSQAPLLISHTGCNAIHAHPRNNDDEELRAVADAGGVVGIYLMPFLDGGSGELTTDMLFAHLEHALEVCGHEHVGIGSDQRLAPIEDGPEYRARLRREVARRRRAGISAPGESAERPPFIPALNRSDRLAVIGELMAGRGHAPAVIEAVLGRNFRRVMRAAWG